MKTTKSAEQWAIEFNGGSELALSYFLNTLTGKLKNHAFKILFDMDLAEDKIAESFVKLWARRSTFNHPKVIQAWMFITVQNACFTELAKQKRLRKENNNLLKITSEADGDNAEIQIIKQEELRNLTYYLSKLPSQCGRILFMMYDGMKAKEISEVLNLNVSTVKNQFARGKDLLLKMLSSGQLASPLVSVMQDDKRELEYVFEEH
jgi:RNA polymerase sigma-70 factor (ECF subfamily)